MLLRAAAKPECALGWLIRHDQGIHDRAAGVVHDDWVEVDLPQIDTETRHDG